jgi:molecular chaperone GrpE
MSDALEEEFVPDEDGEGAGPLAIKKLREKLALAVKEKQEYLEGWQRARADFANYKKEEASLHHDKEERMQANLIETLLPTLDVLEMALKHEPSSEMVLVHKQFQETLKQLGVESVGSVGEEFDPHRHEALAQVADDTKEEHTIASIMRLGYKIGERILRPAQVTIYTKSN